VPPHEVQVFEPGQPKVRCRFQLPQGLRDCAVSPDGQWVVTCCHPGDGAPETAVVWDGYTGRRVHVLPVEEAKRAAFSPNGRRLVTGTEHQGCQLWTVGDWKLAHRFPRASFAFSPDSELLAFDDELGTVRLVRTATGKEVLRLAGPEHNRYEPGCFTPDGAQLIATDAATGSLYVWDLRMIRQGVRSLDLDWEGPEYPPAVESQPLTVRLDNTLPR
jgi:WD40 repeat protein